MKRIILIAFLFTANMVRAELNNSQINKFADCVKLIENSKNYPYGVKSINTHANEKLARQITINSIKNNYKRWKINNLNKSFPHYFADRWCPPQSDLIGNKNWRNNIDRMFTDKIK